MRYFVRGPDGRLYGPAEIEALRDWARADRLPSYATLIAEDTLVETTADEVLGDPQTWPPSVPGMRPCPHCGRAIPVQNGFCPHCGAGRRNVPIGEAQSKGWLAAMLGASGCVAFAVIGVIIVVAVALSLLLGLMETCKNI